MEQPLRKYCLLPILVMLCGCHHSRVYTTHAPIKESLAFINNGVCIYKRYDLYDRDSIIVSDTCAWEYHPYVKGYVSLYRKGSKGQMELSERLKNTNLNFVYDICPKWYNIKQWEFQKHAEYKSPLFQDFTMSLPPGLSREDYARICRRLHPTFADKYGSHCIMNDTIVSYGSFVLWFRTTLQPLFLFAHSRQIKGHNPTKVQKDEMFEMVANSYEYVNYKINYERKIDFSLDSIRGKLFSFIGDSCKKESLRFINDSVCTHYSSARASVSSRFIPLASDTIHYSVRNNLIGIELVKGKSCDTLTYSNGILFYSKVYKEDNNEKYTHIVKPFIDETRSCTSKADSINMIMSAYFSVYVPLNLYK